MRIYKLLNPVIAQYIKINVTKIFPEVIEKPKSQDTIIGAPLVISSSEAGELTQLEKGLPSPVGMTYDDGTNMVYISSKKYNWVIPVHVDANGKNPSMGDPILVGQTPTAIAVDPYENKTYVANWGSNTVSILGGPSINHTSNR